MRIFFIFLIFLFIFVSFINFTHKPGLTAKRIIKCIGERLRLIDPARWENVPITFKTHFRDEDDYSDITTCVHIHEALEREFGIEIKDRQVLISDIETAFSIVMHSHEAI